MRRHPRAARLPDSAIIVTSCDLVHNAPLTVRSQNIWDWLKCPVLRRLGRVAATVARDECQLGHTLGVPRAAGWRGRSGAALLDHLGDLEHDLVGEGYA